MGIVNENEDRVEGVIVNEDWTEKPPEEFYKLTDTWRPVRAIFNSLHARYVTTIDIYPFPMC